MCIVWRNKGTDTRPRRIQAESIQQRKARALGRSTRKRACLSPRMSRVTSMRVRSCRSLRHMGEMRRREIVPHERSFLAIAWHDLDPQRLANARIPRNLCVRVPAPASMGTCRRIGVGFAMLSGRKVARCLRSCKGPLRRYIPSSLRQRRWSLLEDSGQFRHLPGGHPARHALGPHERPRRKRALLGLLLE